MAFNMNVKEGSIEFPAGLRVLVIDDDPHLLASLLRQCQYHVTCASGAITEEFLLVNKNKFDLAIVNVDMPEVDGFMLLHKVELQMDLPVIMLSSHDDKEFIMKGIIHGACDYLNKPNVRIEKLNELWIRVARRKKLNFDKKKSEKCEGVESGEELNHNNKRNKKRKEIENEGEEKQQHSEVSPTNNKKTRLVWEKDLHQKFMEAVDQLGLDKAVPKKILELMNDKRLSRDNVASHLQKYRFNLRKDAEAMIHQENMNHSSSYPPARALTRSNTVEPELNTYNTSTGMIEWHQPSDHNMIINVDPISTVDPRLMQQNNWPRAVQPISYHHDQAPLSRFHDHNAPTPYGFNDHNAPTPLNDFIHHNVLTPSSGFNGHYAPTPSNRFNNHNVPPSSGFNGQYASTPPNGFNDHNAPTPSSGFNDHNALTPPNCFNNHNAPTPNGFNDHNAPTAHYINQTYFQGNTFGVPYQEADDQFFQGFEFHVNDEVFHYAPKK